MRPTWWSITIFVTLSMGYQTYCRCQCGDESQVLELELPKDGPTGLNNANICQLCTRDRCREEIEACSKIPKEDSLDLIDIQCFTRESFKIKLVVYLFVFIVTALLLNIVWWSRQTV